MHHNYRTYALEPGGRNCWNPRALEPVFHKRSHRNEQAAQRACTPTKKQLPLSETRETSKQQQRPSTARNKEINFFFFYKRWMSRINVTDEFTNAKSVPPTEI